MPTIRYRSNAGRARVRLLSTPTQEGDTMSTTVAGTKFSDKLGALLVHALDHGFRIENDTRGKKGATHVLILAPDRTVAPITVSERGARFNKAHYENIRRDLYRAGLPPLPEDEARVSTADAAVQSIVEATEDDSLVYGDQNAAEAAAAAAGGEAVALSDLDFSGENGAFAYGKLVYIIGQQGGIDRDEAAAIGKVAELLMAFFGEKGTTALESRIRGEVAAEVTGRLQREVNDALAMASEAEATAERATKALAAAEARETKAREDCKAALARATAAEAKAADLEKAIAPLRTLLNASA